MKKLKEQFQKTIDSKFSDIQRYIYENKSLTDDQKENMISLCMECNDMILKIYSKEV